MTVDVRVVAATNRDLEAEVAAGRFREDLYFRLACTCVRVPPLRERLSDIPALADQFLTGICARFGMRRKKIAPDALELLMAYEWRRNNVRELRNVVERMIIAADGEVDRAGACAPRRSGLGGVAAPRPGQAGHGFQELKAEAERRIIAVRAGAARLARDPDRRGARPGRPRQPAQDHAPARDPAAGPTSVLIGHMSRF